jgi:hypothetical protein
MVEKRDLEIRVLVDADGDYAVDVERDYALDRYESNIGNAVRKVIRVTLKNVALKEDEEVQVTAPENAGEVVTAEVAQLT